MTGTRTAALVRETLWFASLAMTADDVSQTVQRAGPLLIDDVLHRFIPHKYWGEHDPGVVA
jgi:hypothetical protein